MFGELIAKRRSIYNLGKSEVLSKDEIVKTIENAVKQSPSAFNSQSPRVVILFEKHHEKLWNIVLDTLKAMIPEATFKNTQAKVDNCFKSGFGTVLFFEEDETTKELQAQFPMYAQNFPTFAEHANAIAQFAVWTALAEKKIGATLQHYNPIIDEAVKKEWNIPSSWRLIAQMPFGSIEKEADAKEFMPIENRVKVFK
ncbi:MAG: nitroreductase family protein [Alphaproteobacteria bacterium]|nr:nitroreductase family protein [Alphaproteobacteria bacterium]